MRWSVFMMKWPDVLRWIRRGPRLVGASANGVPASGAQARSETQRAQVVDRLALLEQAGAAYATLDGWTTALKAAQVPEKTRWLQDEELFEFFRESRGDTSLSAGVGHGLW